MTEAEIKSIAENAADGALRKFLLMIGVDVSSHPAVLELQKDFAKIRHLRTVERKIGDKIIATITGSAMTGIIAAIGYYVMHGPK